MIKTTICVMDTTNEKVKSLKLHPRQSSEDVINQLIRFFKENSSTVNLDLYELKVSNGRRERQEEQTV